MAKGPVGSHSVVDYKFCSSCRKTVQNFIDLAEGKKVDDIDRGCQRDKSEEYSRTCMEKMILHMNWHIYEQDYEIDKRIYEKREHRQKYDSGHCCGQ